ncbi:hypothetical protein Aduo_017072 [Ancylostoma duodenale]
MSEELLVEPLGPDAVRYMSVIRRVQLDWDGSQRDLPKSVIIKIPCSTAANNTFESSGATVESADSLEKNVAWFGDQVLSFDTRRGAKTVAGAKIVRCGRL